MFGVYIPAEKWYLPIKSDEGEQGYKVGGKKYYCPKVVPFPAALAADMAATGFEEAENPELAAWGIIELLGCSSVGECIGRLNQHGAAHGFKAAANAKINFDMLYLSSGMVAGSKVVSRSLISFF